MILPFPHEATAPHICRYLPSFTTPEDRTSIFTPVTLAHQKNNEGNSIIHDYLLKDYDEPKDLASFLYVSQALQVVSLADAFAPATATASAGHK